ncbi:MAG: hypothetical protein K8F91_11555 [Candidatus Obscuribacterales bacterium]|nr:hypothetical protein [Candidatus Obscuribacterales bacterium]
MTIASLDRTEGPMDTMQFFKTLTASTPISAWVLKSSLLTMAAIALALTYGINVLVVCCAAVSLGELLAQAVPDSMSQAKGFCPSILALNILSWLSPLSGLLVAGFTFGIANSITDKCAQRRFYKTISVAAIALSLGGLAILNLIQ